MPKNYSLETYKRKYSAAKRIISKLEKQLETKDEKIQQYARSLKALRAAVERVESGKAELTKDEILYNMQTELPSSDEDDDEPGGDIVRKLGEIEVDAQAHHQRVNSLLRRSGVVSLNEVNQGLESVKGLHNIFKTVERMRNRQGKLRGQQLTDRYKPDMHHFVNGLIDFADCLPSSLERKHLIKLLQQIGKYYDSE